LLADPATTELATNVDRDACSFTLDLEVEKSDRFVVQEANPSVSGRIVLNEPPPLQVSSVEVAVKPSPPFLVPYEPACGKRR
jgi:hypothetical protein